MRYPSCYVLVTDMDDTPSNAAQKAAGLSPDEPSMYQGPLQFLTAVSYTFPLINVFVHLVGPIPPVESPCLRQQSSANSWIKQEPPSPMNIAEITWQESMLSPPSDPSDAPPGHWDFVDPTRKLLCSCSKYVPSPIPI